MLRNALTIIALIFVWDTGWCGNCDKKSNYDVNVNDVYYYAMSRIFLFLFFVYYYELINVVFIYYIYLLFGLTIKFPHLFFSFLFSLVHTFLLEMSLFES